MAKMFQGILGGLSGKVSNVIGSSWKGIPILKSKPLSVANPRTAAQVAQRDKFSNCVAFAREILSSVIKPLWDRFASQQSGFNAFISANVDLFASAIPSPLADLSISQGKMSAPLLDVAEWTDNSVRLDVLWDDTDAGGFKLTTDIPYLVVVNATNGMVFGYDGSDAGVTRADGAIQFDVSEKFTTGDTIHIYLAFKRADGTVVSNTAYILGSEV